jgi:hypothetical protein
MSVNYGALRGGRATSGTPDDGLHLARLERASIVESKGVPKLVTEWHDEQTGAWWKSWDTLDEHSNFFTRSLDLLTGLGIDLATLDPSRNPLEDALINCEGRHYEVRTEARHVAGYDQPFVNTFVEATVDDVPATQASRAAAPAPATTPPAQQQSLTDVPVDQGDYEPPAELTDDDIPFLWRPDDWEATRGYNPFAR